jgi:glucose-1-phosphate cytidylyltransferase
MEDVVILCGGRGTRLREHTETIPKPLVEIGGRPILWHVIRIYAEQGFRRFLLCLGHRGEMIEEFVRNDGLPADLTIECVDTGEDTPTGGRIALVEHRLGGGSFCATYADGVADVDLRSLLEFHHRHGALATITVVRPDLPFGVARLNGAGRVEGFVEKPRFEGWINGGFFCFERGVLDYLGEDSVLEREPFERLAADGQLRAYRHTGFWDCMDTYKDAVLLNDLWNSERAPWKLWS